MDKDQAKTLLWDIFWNILFPAVIAGFLGYAIGRRGPWT